MQTLLRDIRFAIRQLLKNPGFTAVALLSLALGIGATTAIFSVVSGVLINPYPYAKPSEIWWPSVKGREANQNRQFYRIAEYEELKNVPAFAEVMATDPGRMLLTGEFAPENLTTIRISGSGFPFLGVAPEVGRTIGPSDIRPGGVPEPVAVLSFKMWKRLFNADPSALGKTLRLNDQPYTVIGVMPPRFGWWTDDGCWIPLAEDRRDSARVAPLVRLKPGLSPAAAEQQLQSLHQTLANAVPGDFPKGGFTSALTNYMNLTVASGSMSTSLHLLFGAVFLLLLIACANVANLQLARSTSRAKEMAIRRAVGAGRGRLIRQLLTESILLALIGGLLGLVFAMWIIQIMVALMPGFYVPNEARIEINRQVMLFSIVVSMLTGIIFGLAPALRSSRADLTENLRESTRGSGISARGGRTRSLLVVAEVALALVLLVSAALTMRSFVALQSVGLGFRPDHILTTDVPLVAARYPTLEQRNRFARELLERIRNTPGVTSAVIGNGMSPLDAIQLPFSIEGQSTGEQRRINVRLSSPDFLSTFGIPLKRGRMFNAAEVDGLTPVAVVNESALGLWPAGQDAIGQRIRIDALAPTTAPGAPANPNLLTPPGASPYVTIIGIVGNTRNDGLTNEPRPDLVIPYTLIAPTSRNLAIRTLGDPKAFTQILRSQLSEIDKDQPLGRPTTVEEDLGQRSAQARFVMALFGVFAALGLSLAAVGIYSVLSYLVTERTHEIGVRMALGARPAGILWLVIRRGLVLTLIGILLGCAGSLALNRLLASQLFGITSSDPITFIAVSLVLILVALLACLVPAQRAARVDPIVALRYE